MPDYNNGLIYKLICNDISITEKYIGSCVDYNKRKDTHKSDCYNVKQKAYNTYKYKFIRENGGLDNWSMILIKYFPCNSRRELECEERVQMDLLGGELNTNTPFITDEEKKEYHKEYKEKNKEEIKERERLYRENNKEKIKETKNQHYKLNKEKINGYKNQKFDCECSGKYTQASRARHFSSPKHINYINNPTNTS